MASGDKPSSAAQSRRCCSMAANRSGALTAVASRLYCAAALTYANLSSSRAMTWRSRRSISARISARDSHWSGDFTSGHAIDLDQSTRHIAIESIRYRVCLIRSRYVPLKYCFAILASLQLCALILSPPTLYRATDSLPTNCQSVSDGRGCRDHGLEP